MTYTSTNRRLMSLPVFWQVLGLGLTVLVMALAINTLIVLKAPEPPPSGYSLNEVARALKGEPVRLRNGQTLTATTAQQPPAFLTAHRDLGPVQVRFETLEAALATRLAAQLGVAADAVTLRFAPPDDGPRRRFGGSGWPHPPGGLDRGPHRVRETFVFEGTGDPTPLPDKALPPGERGVRIAISGDFQDAFFPGFNVAWKLADGSYRVITPPQSLIQPWQTRLLIGFGLTALLILPLAWWLSQRLSRPIVAFSEAAAKIGIEDSAPPAIAEGPREVRQAAQVLNAMRLRLHKQMENRTALMGAIAHDLKTPLARMRLRIEDLPQPLRDKLSDDIAHMDGLIRSAMSFTSAHRLGDSLRPLDLSALVEALADDLCAVCAMEPAQVERHVMVRGDTVALKRILTNLVENAGRYATGCRIELATRGDTVEVRVLDDGPGLPPDSLEAVFEPFFRMETSRNRETGGTGLGLSVARSLAQAQGGTLTLNNRYEGAQIKGLEARLVMPRL